MNDDEFDIHHGRRNLDSVKLKIAKLRNGPKAIAFLDHMEARGRSALTVLRYGSTLPLILNSLDIETVGRGEIEKFVADINRKSEWSVFTRRGYKQTVKKLIQYVRLGDTSKETPFPPEVSWIRYGVSERDYEKNSRVSSDALLNSEEIEAILKATRNPRDEAMLTVLFEGAFRPGEMLAMRIGSVEFLQEYCVVSINKGKTGKKRIPLVISQRALLKWLSQHPGRSDPYSPLWCGLDTGHHGGRLSYSHFRDIVNKSASRAGIKKDVWPYLYRHTGLTNMADKLTESKLNLFAGWRMGSAMPRRYVHWSGRDLDRSVLELHGLAKPEKVNHALTIKACPRCQTNNSPASVRCETCGLVLDQAFAKEMDDSMLKRIEDLEATVRNMLSQGTRSSESQAPQGDGEAETSGH